MSFLVKRVGGWYDLRVKVPADLTDKLGKSDLSVSLGTKSKRKARRLLPEYRDRYWQCFDLLRQEESGTMGKTLSQEVIRHLVRRYVKDKLELQTFFNAVAKPVTDDGSIDDLESAENALSIEREALGTRHHVKFMGDSAENLLAREGYSSVAREAMEFKVLCYEMMRASIRILEAERASLLGRTTGHTQDHVLKDLGLSEVNSMQPATPIPLTDAEPAAPSTSPTLQDLVEEFKQVKIESGKWNVGTAEGSRTKFRALLQVLGADTPVDRITVDQAREYAKILSLLPPSFFLKGYKDLSKINSGGLEGKHDKILDVKTRTEYLNLARSLFQFGVDNEYLEKNPVIKGLIPPKKSNMREQRSPFTQEDLKRIFDPKIFGKWIGDSAARYWLPRLALYTGGRLEETANLRCDDVFQITISSEKHEESSLTETGGLLWCIDHNLDNGRQLKNKNAVRTIPLHPKIAGEFAEYVDSVRDPGQAGGGMVFPELAKRVNGRHSHYFSKSFGYYLRKKIGITDRAKVFHSFRHLVTDTLYKGLVQESLIEEFTGRAGKTETSRRYAKGYRVETLYRECVLKLDFKLP